MTQRNVTELIEIMMSHACNRWIERDIDYLAVLWRIKTLCEEEKVFYTRRTTYRAKRFDQLVTWKSHVAG
jgi:hypothetical protein